MDSDSDFDDFTPTASTRNPGRATAPSKKTTRKATVASKSGVPATSNVDQDAQSSTAPASDTSPPKRAATKESALSKPSSTKRESTRKSPERDEWAEVLQVAAAADAADGTASDHHRGRSQRSRRPPRATSMQDFDLEAYLAEVEGESPAPKPPAKRKADSVQTAGNKRPTTERTRSKGTPSVDAQQEVTSTPAAVPKRRLPQPEVVIPVKRVSRVARRSPSPVETAEIDDSKEDEEEDEAEDEEEEEEEEEEESAAGSEEEQESDHAVEAAEDESDSSDYGGGQPKHKPVKVVISAATANKRASKVSPAPQSTPPATVDRKTPIRSKVVEPVVTPMVARTPAKSPGLARSATTISSNSSSSSKSSSGGGVSSLSMFNQHRTPIRVGLSRRQLTKPLHRHLHS